MTTETVDVNVENNFLDGREGQAKALEQSLSETDKEHDFVPCIEQSGTVEHAEHSELNAPPMTPEMIAGIAAMAMGTYETVIQSLVGKEFSLPDEMKKEAVQKYSPLIVKYGPAAMVKFGQYQDEIMGGLFTVALVRESFSQCRKIKHDKALKQQAEKEAQTPPETTADAVSEVAA
ncbi:hypothetical protein [Pseudoalteromonas aurantia]|uniref:DUF3306 domain-containing protein n=1 Tax=Pseudoalteromonas aurantia TaxID=43654 RepID=A0ABY2VYR0_9GAMM|nr:hypothetical protein [Pseudoalteromonas aurantia]TMO75324.1 hypothetical protein CWC20_08360 [Pseudoalteromonas aurantia]